MVNRKLERIEWKVPVSVMLETSTVDEIDNLRNGTPRSNYLREIIIEAIKIRIKDLKNEKNS